LGAVGKCVGGARKFKPEYIGIGPEEVEARWRKAQELARRAHWEGDVREGSGGPWFCPIPMPGTVEYLIAWKQDNNGESFVASPFPLPWLEEDAAAVVRG
jgi:hypothetical protein